LRCRVNEAYNHIHYANFSIALTIIRGVIQSGKDRGDHGLLAMARSARLFCKRVRRASVRFKLGVEGEDISGDELFRIRTGVNNRVKRR